MVISVRTGKQLHACRPRVGRGIPRRLGLRERRRRPGDDPLGGGWTALQSWDPREGSGALLAFRQESGESTRTIALRNVPPGRTFSLSLAPGGTPVASVTSEQLNQGIEVQIPESGGAYVVSIEPQ